MFIYNVVDIGLMMHYGCGWKLELAFLLLSDNSCDTRIKTQFYFDTEAPEVYICVPVISLSSVKQKPYGLPLMEPSTRRS